MKYEGFLFDLDGTLIDTTELIIQSFKKTLTTVGVIVERDGIISLIGRPLYDQLRIHLNNRDDVNYEELMHFHMMYQIKNWKNSVVVFDGIIELLNNLKKNGAKMGIVTSRKEKTARLYTEELNLAHYFDVLVTPEVTKKHKPDKEPALYSLEKLGLNKEKTAFIGDSIFDMQCAENAGIDGYFVSWGAGKTKELTNIKIKGTAHDVATLEQLILG